MNHTISQLNILRGQHSISVERERRRKLELRLRVAGIVAVGIVLLILSGCDFKQLEWQAAPFRYFCSVEQSAKVQREAAWCSDNTSYLNTYCYGAAIMRNCSKLEAK